MSTPDWIEVLRAEVKRTSQRQVAARIGYSDAVISGVLKGKYGARSMRVEEAVRGALMGATVECPVIGDIPRNRCIDHQRRAGTFAATNPLRVALSKTCPHCEYAKEAK